MNGDGVWRDPGESALNRLQQRCRAAGDLHQQAADRAEAPAVRDLFAGLARTHRAWAEQLERRVHARGAPPEDVDPDGEDLRRLWTALRQWLARGGDEPLLAERGRTESELLAAADEAFAEDLSPQERELVRRIREGARAARDRLRRGADGDD